MDIKTYIGANYKPRIASVSSEDDILSLAKLINIEDVSGDLDGYTFQDILTAIYQLSEEI